MRHDAPAALPLLAYVVALAGAPWMVSPRATTFALVALAILAVSLRTRLSLSRRRSTCVALLAFAAGCAIGTHGVAVRKQKGLDFAAIDAGRFVTVEAPLEHDWSARDGSWALRADRFRAGGAEFHEPVIFYARFEPPPVRFSTTLVAEGFLRRNEQGVFTMSVKSPRLMQTRGTLSRLDPSRWNRALAFRVEPLADRYPTEVALVEALALGRGERLSDPLRESFKRGGTYHLLVFSGLQIAVAAGAIAWALRALGGRRSSDWLLLGFAALAPPFIGTTSSVARASVAIGLYALSRILTRPTSFENLWAFAALLQLVAVPSDLTSAAFHLTYGGAGAMLFIAKPAIRHRWIAAPLAAEVVIVPLTLFHFHQYAIGGSVVTVLMTPVIFVMLVVSALACAIPCAQLMVVMSLLNRLCGVLNAAGRTTSGFFAAPTVEVVIACGLGSLAAIAFFHSGRRAVLIATLASIPTLFALSDSFRKSGTDTPEMITLDVGQGDAIVVRSGTQAILVDGGGRNEAARFGETTLLPLLVDRGIRRIDAVALTHAHPDHCGGIPAVLEHLSVGSMWIQPRRFSGPCATTILEACMASGTPIHIVRDGDRLPLAGLHVTALLSPGSVRRAAENNSSLVLRVQAGSRRLLLTGDVERESERALVGRPLRADVLKVAHHGSRSSSTPEMLEAVDPRVAVVSCGRNNLFGHPHPEVLEALRRRRIRTLRTDRSGTVRLLIRDHALFVIPEIDTPR